MDIYVDESGDLGFSEKATKFFIIAYLAIDSSLIMRTQMKRTLKELHQRRAYHAKQDELKFCKMGNECRKAVLERIVKTGGNIGVLVVSKETVKPYLRDKLPVLYNWLMVHNVISALIPNLEMGQKIHITFDKSLSKARVTEFNHYVKEKASYLSYVRGNSIPQNLIVSDHIDSRLEPCLQAVDSIAGAYFQKYENSNDEYANIIKDVTSFTFLWRK